MQAITHSTVDHEILSTVIRKAFLLWLVRKFFAKVIATSTRKLLAKELCNG
jgi:hypothetical protein